MDKFDQFANYFDFCKADIQIYSGDLDFNLLKEYLRNEELFIDFEKLLQFCVDKSTPLQNHEFEIRTLKQR